MDPVPVGGCLEVLAGTHLGPGLMPRTFLAGVAKWFPDGTLAELPDVDADPDAFDIKRYEMAPGGWTTSPPFAGLDRQLTAGSPMEHPLFPVVWPPAA